MTYELHSLCTLFPRMAGAEFDALRDDIKANGLRSPIVLHDRMILDGGNRYRACIEAGVTPAFVNFAGGNLVAFVLSANMHRRHMTPGQQAAIVASAQDWGRAQKVGGDRRTDQSQALDFDSVEKRAAASGTSRVTQMMADKVAKADPELARQVAHGAVSLPAAAAAVDEKAGKAKPAKPAKGAPDPSIGQDAHGDTDPVVELEKAYREIEQLEGVIKAAEANDTTAEAVKWRKAYDAAVRGQSEAMDKAHKSAEREKVTKRQLMRCGKAVGEDDEFKIAPAVEAMARALKGAKVAA